MEVQQQQTSGVFSALDFLVIGCISSVAIYWLIFREKKTNAVAKPLMSMPTPIERSLSYDPSFVNKMKKTGKNVIIFYGSQTGTAEDFANRLAKDAARYHLKAMVADPEECEMDDLTKLSEIENSLLIFCVATYGEGDPTDNAHELYDWLKENESGLQGVLYTVFALGNKTYEQYNAMGLFVDARMEELGATRIFPIGMGDDDCNIEEDFITWRESFWPAVCERFGIEKVGDEINVRQYALTEYGENDRPKQLFTGEVARLNSFVKQKPPFDAKNPFLATVTVNRELHKAGDRSCMHIEFDMNGSKIRYDAGDHLAVCPMNNSELVTAIGGLLGIDLDVAFSLNNVDEDASKLHPFPCPTTYRTALTHYLDITSTPHINLLKDLAEHASDEKDKQLLLKMTAPTPDGKELYNEWIKKANRNILAVLEDLPSFRPPIDHLCELLPKLQPRYYSISSSPKVHRNSIHITAVLVEWTTPTGRSQKGVATSWLKTKKAVSDEELPHIPVFVRKSQFRLPFNPQVSVIMIGPGTGIAPFRGFIQDRHALKTAGKAVGETVLYCGCRHRAEDYIYESELEEYHRDGTLTQLHCAFSRDQPHKVYVQHLMRQNMADLWRLLQNGAHIYVCGDARNMAHDVDEVLVDTAVSEGNMDKAGAQDYLKKLRSRGRYSCDVWS